MRRGIERPASLPASDDLSTLPTYTSRFLTSATFPLLPGDPRLPEQPPQESWPNIALVLVGDDEGQVAFAHLRMPSACVGALETQFTQSLDEGAPGNGAQSRHFLNSRALSYVV